MNSCCQTSTEKPTTPTQCPVCKQKGKGVQLITLKALLKPRALETIHTESTYAFVLIQPVKLSILAMYGSLARICSKSLCSKKTMR